VTGTVTDGVTAQPLAGAAIRIDVLGQTTSAADGTFGYTTSEAPAVRGVSVTSPSTVDRSTWALVPGPHLTVPLMPSSLNLTAFEQMFRGNSNALRRWTDRPRIVIQRRTLRFAGTANAADVATASLMSDAEADALLADLTWALPQLTGDAFTSFADPQVEAAAEGEAVPVPRPGVIFVARYDGLTAATTFWGYSRWAWNAAGAIQSGVIMIDQGFDASASPFRRSLRAHELGHALGYNHVTSASSVMVSAARTEPNDFDRAGARMAFARPLLNRYPDIDPAPTASVTADTALTWRGAP